MPYDFVSGGVRRSFACVNSGKGFISYFDGLLSGVRRHFIIKGGPGTGKSGLMRAVADAAEARGEPAFRILCSSDPDSLDGVILPSRSVAITDGTAPHTAEPETPGIDGEFLDLGAFWDREKLTSRADGIRSLNAAKRAAYARAFSLLAAARQVRLCADARIDPLPDRALLRRRAGKILKNMPHGARSARCVLPMRAFGMSGAANAGGFEEAARKLLPLKAVGGSEVLFLETLESEAEARGISCFRSPDPLTLRPDALFFPAERLLVRRAAGDEPGRFADGGMSSPPPEDLRAALRELKKEERSLLLLAEKEMRGLRVFHFSLEKIYGAAMDFSRVDRLKETLVREIFKA